MIAGGAGRRTTSIRATARLSERGFNPDRIGSRAADGSLQKRKAKGLEFMGKLKALTVPRWGMAMEEGTVVAWLANEGDAIDEGTEIAELESSKIVNVLESHDTGILRRRTACEGDTLPVGALLGVISTSAATDEEIDAFISQFRRDLSPPIEAVADSGPPADAAAKMSGGTVKSPTAGSRTMVPDLLKKGGRDTDLPATPHARRFASRHGINLNSIAATGRHDRVLVADIERAIRDSGGRVAAPERSGRGRYTRQPSTCNDRNINATPMARRLAGQFGVNLNDCRVSGTRGRVSSADVEALIARSGRRSPDKRTRVSGMADSAGMPLAGMRRTIADRLQASKRDIPHYRLSVDVNIDMLMDARAKFADSGQVPTVNDFLVRACGLALMKVPACNIQFDGSVVQRFPHADVAVAVALEGGLITPVVRSADTKSVSQISAELRALLKRARAGGLRPDEYEGGTFTISNLGMFGIRQFDAIINPPQACVLAAGRAAQRPVVRDGNVTVATMLTLTLSCDHRVIDGATGAQFLSALSQVIESPEHLNMSSS